MKKFFYKIEPKEKNSNQHILANESNFGLYRNLLAEDCISFHLLAGRIKDWCDYNYAKMPTEQELGFALLRLVQEGLVGMTDNAFECWTVGFKKNHPDAVIPSFGSTKAAGLDISSIVDVKLVPGQRCGIDTGLSVQIPPGHEMEIRPRSGMALKKGFTVLNSPGTIDEDYTGNLVVIGVNLGHENIEIKKGDRIAQACVRAVPRVVVIEVDEIKPTERGSGGLGSTGR